jgi:hypothetical protein
VREHDRETDPDAVDRDVERARVALRHEALVELVAHRVEDGDRGGEPGASEAQRAGPQQPQQPELGHVDELAPDEVDHPEPAVEVRLRGQEEDEAHEGHRWGEAAEGVGHGSQGRARIRASLLGGA